MADRRDTDEALLEQRAPGLAGPSFAAFYRRHERLVLGFHVRRVGDPDVAADLAAETFARALDARGRFRDRGPGSALAWLYGIAANVLATSARKQAVEQRKCARLRLDRPVLDDAGLVAVVEAGTEPSIVAALDELPEQQRDAVRAYVLEEQPYDEIAAQLGVDPATVRKRVSRGLAALRRDAKETP